MEPEGHGIRARYNQGCRCKWCVMASRIYLANLRRLHLALGHKRVGSSSRWVKA